MNLSRLNALTAHICND